MAQKRESSYLTQKKVSPYMTQKKVSPCVTQKKVSPCLTQKKSESLHGPEKGECKLSAALIFLRCICCCKILKISNGGCASLTTRDIGCS